ncbi:MAG: ACP S-malonyltransferase [Burkholderiales bacterium]|nr:ACP S-malonyltransferase [Burkholderiales bacterium]
MRLALVFPGQGSQSVGMLAAYADHAEVRSTIAEASDVLGQDLWALIETGPEAALNQTINTQPIMLAADVAVYRAWVAAGGAAPAVMAGHSLGEYAALVVAGSLSLRDALPLVRIRAEAMQQAVPEGVGGIAAILGLDEVGVREACLEAAGTEVVEPANLNAPGQIVIAGHRAAVERAIEACKAKGAKRGVLLPMSVPSHCSLMRGAGEVLRGRLAAVNLAPPAIPVINNADVAQPNDPVAIRDALVRQLASPVRWIETIRAMADQGVTHIVECGPGKVLQGLVKRIAPEITGSTLSSSQTIVDAVAAIRQEN